MSFSISGKETVLHLSKLQKLVSRPFEFVYVHSSKKGYLYLTAINDLFKAQIRILTEVTKEIEFGININILQGVCAKREMLDFSIKDSKLIVKAQKGKYTSELSTVPYEKISIDKQDKDIIQFDDKLKKIMLDAISKISLESIHDDSSMISMIRVNNSYFNMVIADKYHAAWYKCKLRNSSDLELDFPLSYVNVIKELDDNNLNISSDNNLLYIWNKNYTVSLPHVAQTDNITYDGIVNKIKEMKEFDNQIEVEVNKLSTILDNLMSIHEEGVSIKAKIIKDKLYLENTTSFGKIADAIVGNVIKSNKKTINVEIHNVSDIIRLINKKVKISFFKDRLCVFEPIEEKKNKIVYIASNL